MIVIIETPRLLLLSPEAEHAQALAAVFGDANAMRYIGDGSVWSQERIETLVGIMRELQSKHGFCLWPVAFRETKEVIGDCGLCFIRHSVTGSRGPEVEVGYHFRSDVWGRGFASEAASAALDYGFSELALRRVIGVVQLGNTASKRVLTKCGMQPEGETDQFYDRTLALFSKNVAAAPTR